MRRLLMFLLAVVVVLPGAPFPATAAEEKLVIYTAYEENELKDFWEQFKNDLPDLAAKASYIRASTGPIMARVEAERANPQADVVWGVFNDYLTGAAKKGEVFGDHVPTTVCREPLYDPRGEKIKR